MKNPRVVFLFFCWLPLAVAAQYKVVENPDYLFKKTGIETISRVELHDTITKLHVHVAFLPNWWVEYSPLRFIQPAGTNLRYHLMALENAEMGKQLRTPSGIADYVLLFPPLDTSVREIHFGILEGYKEEIDIFNISLEKSFDSVRYGKSRSVPDAIARRLEEEIKKTAKKKTVNFDSDKFFDNSPSRLVGYIRGYRGDSLQTHWIHSRRLDGSQQVFPLKLYPDGYFEADLKMEYPKMLSFKLLAAGDISFYIEPGHTLAMILDWEDVLEGDRYRNRRFIFKKTEFAGSLADVNRDLLKRVIFKPDGFALKDRFQKMSPAKHREDLENRINRNLEALRKTDKEHALLPKAKRLIENEIKVDALSELLQFSRAYELRFGRNNRPPTPSAYYSLMETLLPGDRSVLAAQSTDPVLYLLNNTDNFLRPGSIYYPPFKPEQSFREYLVEKGVALSEETKELLPLMQRMFEAEHDAKARRALSPEIKEKNDAIQKVRQLHKAELEAYLRKFAKSNPVEEYNFTTAKREEILTDSMHVKGVLKDACMYFYFREWLNRHSKLSADELKFFTKSSIDRLSNPYLKKSLSGRRSSSTFDMEK